MIHVPRRTTFRQEPLRIRPAALAVAVLVAGMGALAPTASASDHCAMVSVGVDQDACGSTVVVNIWGDSESSGDCSEYVSCVSVSVFGNAANGDHEEACRNGVNPDGMVQCIAISGTGDASNRAGDRSCGTSFASVSCLAVSGTGDASNHAGDESCGGWGVSVSCVAASGSGDAINHVGNQSCPWGTSAVFAGCAAISGLGDASNRVGNNACASSTELYHLSAACLAFSGRGNASNTAGGASCDRPYTPGSRISCVAVDGKNVEDSVCGRGGPDVGSPACGEPADPIGNDLCNREPLAPISTICRSGPGIVLDQVCGDAPAAIVEPLCTDEAPVIETPVRAGVSGCDDYDVLVLGQICVKVDNDHPIMSAAWSVACDYHDVAVFRSYCAAFHPGHGQWQSFESMVCTPPNPDPSPNCDVPYPRQTTGASNESGTVPPSGFLVIP